VHLSSVRSFRASQKLQTFHEIVVSRNVQEESLIEELHPAYFRKSIKKRGNLARWSEAVVVHDPRHLDRFFCRHLLCPHPGQEEFDREGLPPVLFPID